MSDVGPSGWFARCFHLIRYYLRPLLRPPPRQGQGRQPISYMAEEDDGEPPYLVMLAAQMAATGWKNIPPVTLALIAAQIAIFLEMIPDMPSVDAACMSAFLVYKLKEWYRMILATFYHGSDSHLYYNMVSLLSKGGMLENKFGSSYFALLVGLFAALCSLLYVGLSLFFAWLFGDDNYQKSCAVGFSAVLFAFKVLTQHYSPPGTQYLGGVIPVPSKHVYWAELVMIQLMVPNASFVGHLAGILVGLMYTKGPLRYLMGKIITPYERPDEPGEGTSDAPGSRTPSPPFRQTATSPRRPPNMHSRHEFVSPMVSMPTVRTRTSRLPFSLPSSTRTRSVNVTVEDRTGLGNTIGNICRFFLTSF